MPDPIALVYGTRPQTIKAARLRTALAQHWRCITIDTGQHYDYELNGLLNAQLGIQAPDHELGVGSGSHASQTAAIMVRVERLLLDTPAAMLVVIGDTNSTLGATLAALKLRIPVTHVEAGLRGDDPLMPEEINRRLVDAGAQVLCAPSARAMEHLTAEGTVGSRWLTGDIARDVLMSVDTTGPRVAERWLSLGVPYIFATLHRAELIDRHDLLRGILDAFRRSLIPVLFACHPRTLKALEPFGFRPGIDGALTILSPVGYLESVNLVKHAECVITDSGGLQREAYWLGTPCLTIRTKTEWPETVECGANRILAPVDAPAGLQEEIELIRSGRRSTTWALDHYGDGHAAERIVDAIQSHLTDRPPQW